LLNSQNNDIYLIIRFGAFLFLLLDVGLDNPYKW